MIARISAIICILFTVPLTSTEIAHARGIRSHPHVKVARVSMLGVIASKEDHHGHHDHIHDDASPTEPEGEDTSKYKAK